MMTVLFGCYPKSLKAYKNDRIITVIVRYEDYDIIAEYTDFYWDYVVCVSTAKDFITEKCTFDGAFEKEFNEFYEILKDEDNKKTVEDFIAPVFILNAIDRSLKSGNEEEVHAIPEI